jgi:predicted nucleotide-binding protein (sugar kinase/HSP70/actin superfamily)
MEADLSKKLDKLHLEPEFRDFFPVLYSKLGSFQEVVDQVAPSDEPDKNIALYEAVENIVYPECKNELEKTLKKHLDESMKHPVCYLHSLIVSFV